jgi:putative salt-induced outer membrane protein YdiY
VDGDTVRVIGDQDQTFEKSRVLSIVAGEPKEINYWSFKLTFGLNVRSGNTNQIESSSRTRINRRTIKNRINFEYLANYNRTEGEDVADNQRATAGWDKFINDRFYVAPVFLEYFRDPFQNIDQRWTIGAGVGYDLIETKKIDWTVSGGPAYQTTQFTSVAVGDPESEDTPALVAGTVVDIEVTKNLDWDYEYRFQWVNSQSGTYNHHMVTGLDFELTSVLDFNITFVWDRIENPRPAEDRTVPESNDYRMNVGITLDF